MVVEAETTTMVVVAVVPIMEQVVNEVKGKNAQHLYVEIIQQLQVKTCHQDTAQTDYSWVVVVAQVM
jgi:hypothetical protein